MVNNWHLYETWSDKSSDQENDEDFRHHWTSSMDKKRFKADTRGSMQQASLAVDWAKKYFELVKANQEQISAESTDPETVTDFTLIDGRRSKIAHKLKDNLKIVCKISWTKVESLLSEDRQCHVVSQDLIRPTKIIGDSLTIYSQVIEAFASYEVPARLSVIVGRDLIALRQYYSHSDPLVLGFIAMQFYYVKQNLLSCLSQKEKKLFLPYLQIVDDYLCLPIGDIHSLVGTYSINSPTLLAIQHLLQQMTPISIAVYERVSELHPHHRSNNGLLGDLRIKHSSIRDVELFLSYICLCVLEGGIRPLKEELFPLAVMLYPKLHVSWKLVQDMLLVLFWEVSERLIDEDIILFLPYFRVINKMFSNEVLNC